MKNRLPPTEIQAYQTPLAWVHLRWLEEWNLPHLVDLYQEGKLQSYLNEKVDKTEDIIDKLMKAGRNRDQAEESVIADILAPFRENDPPNWPKELLKLIPEIEDSLYIDYDNLETTEDNPQDAKEIQVLDQLRPTNIRDIIFRLEEYIGYMRDNVKEARVFMDFLDQYIKDYFNRPTLAVLELKKTVVEIVDEMYIRISNILIRDIHTNAYFGIIINRLFNELAQKNILVFYVLDNHLRDDRFKVAVELFGISHFNTIHPYAVEKSEYVDGYTQFPSKDYKAVEKEIDDAVGQNKHICYIEKDSSVNYIKNILSLAALCQNEYLCVFRNQATDSYKKATWLMGSFSDLVE